MVGFIPTASASKNRLPRCVQNASKNRGLAAKMAFPSIVSRPEITNLQITGTVWKTESLSLRHSDIGLIRLS